MRSKLLIDNAARKDIEAYGNRPVVAEVAHFAMMPADNVRKQGGTKRGRELFP
jgi:hypothetical protein